MLRLSVNTVSVHRANLMQALWHSSHRGTRGVRHPQGSGYACPNHRSNAAARFPCVGRAGRAGAPLAFDWSTSQPRPASSSRTIQRRLRRKYLPETMGSGCAFLDYDGDGWQDILLVNGMDWPDTNAQRTTLASTATTATAPSPMSRALPVWTSRCTGSASRSGTSTTTASPTSSSPAVGQNRLFQNTGKGTFVDVTAQSRARQSRGLLHLARCGSITIATACSICSSPTMSGGRPRRTSSAAWTGRQVLLHARGVSRDDMLAVPQSRRRDI